MDRFVERLVRLVPPPLRRGALLTWPEVEGALGFELPDDYRQLVSLYGPGKFDDFLAILQPSHPVPRLDLLDAIDESAEVLREYESSGETLPVAVDGLLAIGFTDNGDTMYWIREPRGVPDSWRIAVNGARDFDEWHIFDGGLAHFLLAVLSREWIVPAFADDFPYPDRSPTFTSYEAGPAT